MVRVLQNLYFGRLIVQARRQSRNEKILPSTDRDSYADIKPVCKATIIACIAAGINWVKSCEEMIAGAAKAPVQKLVDCYLD